MPAGATTNYCSQGEDSIASASMQKWAMPLNAGWAEGLSRIMASVNVGMVVVTGRANGEASGCLVGFQGQCSIDPLRWGVWIAKVNHSYPIITTADEIAVHFLTTDQHALATHFGALTGDEVDKFAGVPLDSPGGTPLLSACPNRIIGTRLAVLDGPTDHCCVVIEPTTIECTAPFAPLRIDDVADVAPGHPLRSSDDNERR